MRIPLDYYRILGLPLAASDEQLRQSYSDRIVQLPRREYSQAAISSRKQLIEEAYVVLSNPKERSSYNELYVAHAYGPNGNANATVAVGNHTESNKGDPDPQSLSIDISQQELVGALLILQELGEYELVLKLGHNYLTNQSSVAAAKVGNHLVGDELSESSEYPDIVLTVALACLELGREQWQQGHHENAAISLETGQELLSREGLFASVQAEMQADLYKLRPYRILELLALPEEKAAERRQGLAFLHNILSDRGGIDGTGNDYSGLNIDDFLRFIQQLRHHLTVAEQHKLFEAESKRPSAVANYLAVYASLARGFTQRQPALIRQAKQMLMGLGKRQDVHLEQSLCALLLGQTEEATRVLELSQEYEALAFIRERSLDSPDLLPGLCLYAEQWLQNEVFPHFRDLAQQPASLKDYFATPQVQAYLEALPTEAETTNDWAVINGRSFSQPPRPSNHPPVDPKFPQERKLDPDLPETVNYKRPQQPNFASTNRSIPLGNVANGANPETNVPSFARTVDPARPTNHNLNGTAHATPPRKVKKRRRRKANPANSRGASGPRANFTHTLDGKTRLVWTVFASLAGILVFWLIVSTTFGWVRNILDPTPVLQGEQLAVQLNEPPMAIPDPNSKLLPPEGSLTEEMAQKVIQTWLSTKASALGPSHDIGSLQDILTGATLAQWRLIAQQERSQNRYRTYNHTVNVEYVNQNPDQSVVAVARVREVTQFYERGQINNITDETLRVRYSLIRQADVWRIQNMSVINQVSMNF
ncbi:MAG: IMS domain-containing protein [Nostoc sp. LLA-1]|nr:IMS domain-containing protein [Cyanocohniella sp. LLY]